eukprot:TRINITY_DN34437_c0_g1_i1.p1 TRINITY_DN34437_c0_g1~~TRINITY_DN34437_c0_g1_i1.p1  ORF type:complete len:382 (+),score=90.43 TRINITY_DN34437_c0_g1_i1:25-1146(+)
MDLLNQNSPWRKARWPSPGRSPVRVGSRSEMVWEPSPVPRLGQSSVENVSQPAPSLPQYQPPDTIREMSPHEEDIIKRHVVREVPSKYVPYLGSGFRFHGFKCGAEIEAATDIYIDGELAIKTGVQGVVRGPSDDTDYTRLLVDFYNFHTAINVTPAEIKLKSEVSSKCPGCGMSLPENEQPAAATAAAVAAAEPAAVGGQQSDADDKVSDIAFAEEGFSPAPPESESASVAPPLSVATADIEVAEEGMQPAPDSEKESERQSDIAPEAIPQDSIQPVDETGSIAVAEEGMHPAPETPSVEPQPSPDTTSFYSRFPEARVSRAEHETLKSELEKLKEELAALKSGSQQPAIDEPTPADPVVDSEEQPQPDSSS